MLELDPAMNSLAAEGDAVLLADPSLSGGAIAAALRSRGVVVIEVSAGSLAARALAEAPRAIIVDIDQPGAIDAVERAKELLPSSPPEIFCIGDPLRAAELGVTRAAGRVFGRPVDISAVVFAVARVISSHAPGEFGDGGLGRQPTLPPRTNESEPPAPFSELPSTADPLEVAAIMPSSDDMTSSSKVFLNELSPELERLLSSAEHRVSTQHRPSGLPSPDEELDMLLPPELLAALDEPLDPEEEGGGTGSGAGGTGPPRLPTGNFGSRAQSTPAGTIAETPAGESPARRPTAGELADARSPGPVTPAQATENRFEERLPLPAPWELKPSSTVPPAGPFGSGEPLGREGSPTFEPLPIFRPLPLPKPSVTPVIRDGGAPGRPIALASSSADMGSPAKTNPSLGLGAASADPGRTLMTVESFDPARGAAFAGPSADVGRGAAFSMHSEPAYASNPQEVTAAGRASPSSMPPVALGEGDALQALARAIATRASGAISIGAEPAVRRIVIHDGDIVTAGSTAADESLLAFLAARGDLPREVAAHLAGRLPPFGRHAGAALIAHGYLGQDDLWPVLRAHAEWLIGCAILCDSGTWELESEPPGRLKAEPNVFGGATGAEVLVEQVRRVVPPETALRRIGGASARLAEGERRSLLTECALRREEEALVRSAPGRTVAELLRVAEPEIANVIYVLVALGVLEALAPVAPAPSGAPESVDMLDVEALRQRVRARVALVEDGDYFALLGVPHSATGYEIRRAYLDLRRSFEPARVLTAATADLAGDVRLIVEVLDEAYDILRDPHRRERYRKAIEAGPP